MGSLCGNSRGLIAFLQELNKIVVESNKHGEIETILILHLILAFSEAQNAEDAQTLLRLIEKNGGLSVGNAAFRMADAICSNAPHIAPVQIAALRQFDFFQNREFCQHAVQLAMKRSPGAPLRAILEDENVQGVVKEEGYFYLASILKQTSNIDIKMKAMTTLLSCVDISKRDKTEALGLYPVWINEQQKHEREDGSAIVRCLIKHGADPSVGFENGVEVAFNSFAANVAAAASSYGSNGESMIEALSLAPQWEAILKNRMIGFAWNWYNSGGHMPALLKAVESKKLPNWWEGDPFGVFDAALVEEKSGKSSLFSSLLSHIKKDGVREAVPLQRAVGMISSVLLSEDVSEPDDFIGIFRRECPPEPSAEAFWRKRAPLIAGAFSDPKEWKSLCEKVAAFIAPGPQSAAQHETFIEALKIEVETSQAQEIRPHLNRRRL